MLRVSLFLLTLFVIGLFSISNVFAEEYPVTMDVEMEKTQFEYGEHIRFKVNFEPMTPNSPLKISITNDDNYIENGEIFPKDSETIDNSMGSRTYNPFSTKSDWNADELGFAYFSILPSNIPSGQYSILIEFGSNDIPLAKKIINFSYVNDENSAGQKNMDLYFPTNTDIGTNVKIDEPPVEFEIIHDSYNTILPCDNLSCAITVKKLYSVSSPFYLQYLKIHEFTLETEAKKFAATHEDWDGTPSNRGNSYKVWSPSDVDSNKKQCFEFKGGFSSANGPDGLLKCTNGLFVIEIQSIEQISQDLVESVSDKIDSTPSVQHTPENIESKQAETFSDDVSDKQMSDNVIESKELGIASFVDKTRDPQRYVDRYNNEPEYKKWFDKNYPQYDSIEQAVGLELTQKIPEWVKNIFGWYSQNQVSEDELLNAIKYLITEKILIVD